MSHPSGKHKWAASAAFSLASKSPQAQPRLRRARHDATFQNCNAQPEHCPKLDLFCASPQASWLDRLLDPFAELLSCLLCLPLPSLDASPGARTYSPVSGTAPWLQSRWPYHSTLAFGSRWNPGAPSALQSSPERGLRVTI